MTSSASDPLLRLIPTELLSEFDRWLLGLPRSNQSAPESGPLQMSRHRTGVMPLLQQVLDKESLAEIRRAVCGSESPVRDIYLRVYSSRLSSKDLRGFLAGLLALARQDCITTSAEGQHHVELIDQLVEVILSTSGDQSHGSLDEIARCAPIIPFLATAAPGRVLAYFREILRWRRAFSKYATKEERFESHFHHFVTAFGICARYDEHREEAIEALSELLRSTSSENDASGAIRMLTACAAHHCRRESAGPDVRVSIDRLNWILSKFADLDANLHWQAVIAFLPGSANSAIAELPKRPFLDPKEEYPVWWDNHVCVEHIPTIQMHVIECARQSPGVLKHIFHPFFRLDADGRRGIQSLSGDPDVVARMRREPLTVRARTVTTMRDMARRSKVHGMTRENPGIPGADEIFDETFLGKLFSGNLVALNAWLFTSATDSLSRQFHQGPGQIDVEEGRIRAVERIWLADRVNGLADLVSVAELPSYVGMAFAGVGSVESGKRQQVLLEFLVRGIKDSNAAAFTAGLVSGLESRSEGPHSEFDGVFRMAADTLPPTLQAELFVRFRFAPGTWDRIETSGHGDLYWRSVIPRPIHPDNECLAASLRAAIQFQKITDSASGPDRGESVLALTDFLRYGKRPEELALQDASALFDELAAMAARALTRTAVIVNPPDPMRSFHVGGAYLYGNVLARVGRAFAGIGPESHGWRLVELAELLLFPLNLPDDHDPAHARRWLLRHPECVVHMLGEEASERDLPSPLTSLLVLPSDDKERCKEKLTTALAHMGECARAFAGGRCHLFLDEDGDLLPAAKVLAWINRFLNEEPSCDVKGVRKVLGLRELRQNMEMGSSETLKRKLRDLARLLSTAPMDKPREIWPPKQMAGVVDLLLAGQEFQSELDHALTMMRHGDLRTLGSGGDIERNLSGIYLRSAKSYRSKPNLRDFLTQMAKTFEKYAKHRDQLDKDAMDSLQS